MTKEESLNLVNIRNYEEFENSKVLGKIRRKIESNVDKRQRRNQHWKSYVPNLVSFNRISQPNLCCK
jgi:K+-transporting ATPase A subunit